jgi:hypothetical protein
MTDNLIKQMNHEILIFIGLSVVNIVFSAIALALGIVLIVNNIFILIESQTIINISLGYVIAGGALALIGFWWILPSVSIMDFVTDINLKYDKKNDRPTDEMIINVIIKMISYFRKNSNIINKMIFISRVGGVLFIINGVISSIDLFLQYDPFFSLTEYSMQIIGIILVVSWGIVGLLIPRLISNFSSLWEFRMKEIDEAEEILRGQLES